MHSSDPYYHYIKALLSISLIILLKFSLILTKTNLLYPIPADLAPHISQLFSDIIMDKHYHYMCKHSILALVLIIISYLIFIKKNDLGIFY